MDNTGETVDNLGNGDDEEECSDTCTRMICEWCPEYDRQAELVAKFRAQLDLL